MAIRIIDKRAFLRTIHWDALAKSVTLEDALKVALQGQIQEVATGKVLTGATSNGTTVTFSMPGSSAGMTPQDIARMVASLFDLLESAKADLESPTDAAIFAEMMERLKPIANVHMDYGGLRCA